MLTQRSQRRLSLGISINVILPGSERCITADSQDISWGGACFIVRDPALLEHDGVRLVFPWVNGEAFSADATIVRRKQLDERRIRVSARFDRISRVDQSRLEHFLQLLSHQNERSAPGDRTPIVRAIEVGLLEPEDIRDKLEQIARGRLFITTSGYFEDDQSILLSVSGESAESLRLRARILAQKVIPRPNDAQEVDVELMLAFEHPPQDLESITERDLRVAA